MYREVRMVEIIEVLRLWRDGVPKKRIAARLGLDPKTVRRYVTVAQGTGLRVGGVALSETQLRDVLLALHPGGGRPRGEDWDRCRAQQEAHSWLVEGRPSAHEDSQAAGPPGRRAAVCDAPSVCGRRARVWSHGANDAGGGRRAR